MYSCSTQGVLMAIRILLVLLGLVISTVGTCRQPWMQHAGEHAGEHAVQDGRPPMQSCLLVAPAAAAADRRTSGTLCARRGGITAGRSIRGQRSGLPCGGAPASGMSAFQRSMTSRRVCRRIRRLRKRGWCTTMNLTSWSSSRNNLCKMVRCAGASVTLHRLQLRKYQPTRAPT